MLRLFGAMPERRLVDWYMKRGFVPFGPTFYKNPEEYIRMRIELGQVEG